MASPQTENGYTKIANELIDALTKIRIPGEATQILLHIFRKTYGFNKTEDAISLSQFTLATGLKKNHVCRAINKLEELNLITKKGDCTGYIYRFNKDFDTWHSFPKKGTSPQKREKVVPNKGNKQSPKKGTTKDSKENTKEIRADKPLKDKWETNKYPKTDYAKVLNEYQRLKGIKLQGDEFLPVMSEIKRIFKSGRTVDQINQTMAICEENYEDWSMNTVRMKIADVVGGKLISKNTKPELVVLGKREI